jgi:hypothetical protein
VIVTVFLFFFRVGIGIAHTSRKKAFAMGMRPYLLGTLEQGSTNLNAFSVF